MCASFWMTHANEARCVANAARENILEVLVDGRRLELPTSALRTNGGSGRISLSVRDVNDAGPRNRLEA
jgi:hypothetical protein